MLAHLSYGCHHTSCNHTEGYENVTEVIAPSIPQREGSVKAQGYQNVAEVLAAAAPPAVPQREGSVKGYENVAEVLAAAAPPAVPQRAGSVKQGYENVVTTEEPGAPADDLPPPPLAARSPTFSEASPPPLPTSARPEAAYDPVFHHGAVSRQVAEERLVAVGRWRYLLRASGDATVFSYTASTLKPVGHLKISNEGGTFLVNGQPSPSVVSGMSLDDVVQVVREEACVQVGKQLFPVRDPSKPTGLENSDDIVLSDEGEYVNTSWNVMAAFLSELPATDRPTAEGQLSDRGIDGGFLLRQNGEALAYKATVYCSFFSTEICARGGYFAPIFLDSRTCYWVEAQHVCDPIACVFVLTFATVNPVRTLRAGFGHVRWHFRS
jgi:hypothetical protein